jgi:hypothetical protein
MWHVYFRPEHMWRLISVPHCSQGAYPGERTCFQQLDINVRDFVNIGYGKSFLQGSVSLDNEDEQNCDKSLIGMNRHLEPWWNDVSSRGLVKDAIFSKLSLSCGHQKMRRNTALIGSSKSVKPQMCVSVSQGLPYNLQIRQRFNGTPSEHVTLG